METRTCRGIQRAAPKPSLRPSDRSEQACLLYPGGAARPGLSSSSTQNSLASFAKHTTVLRISDHFATASCGCSTQTQNRSDSGFLFFIPYLTAARPLLTIYRPRHCTSSPKFDLLTLKTKARGLKPFPSVCLNQWEFWASLVAIGIIFLVSLDFPFQNYEKIQRRHSWVVFSTASFLTELTAKCP